MKIDNVNIRPTNHCFDDALDFFEPIITNKQTLDECFYLVVHSICLMPDGRPYAHAWVENPRKGTCIFKGIVKRKAAYYEAEQKEFYANYKVQETTKYTLKQALLENIRTGMYGPWEEKYLALTWNRHLKLKNYVK